MKMRLTPVLNATVAILLAMGLPVCGWGAPVSATGGDIVYDLQEGEIPYRIHVFTNAGSATLTVSNGGFVDCLLVGGGGGGGGRNMGGGGGAGGLISSNRIILAEDVYAVTVGTGGAGGSGNGVRGSNGEDSIFGSITAAGGGGGGSWNTAADGLSGGSGGGASGYGTAYGAASPAGQGNNGGAGATYGAGGGGGASTAGGTGTAQNGGAGGTGVASSLSGVEVVYAGGGGGAAYQGTAGNGGLGGGGAGAPYKGVPTAGIPGTGGGGGGANGYDNINLAGAAGGSGIVMIRYAAGPMTPVPDVTLADAVTGSERFTNSNGVRIATFPAYAGYDQVQCTGENPAISAINVNGWVSTNALSEYKATFNRPATDTNVTLYVWFSNTVDTTWALLRSAGNIYYTLEAPVPVVRTTLTRGRLPGEPAIVTVEDIENGSTPGTADSIVMDLHARQVRTVNPADDLTPEESFASIAEAGEYPVLLWLQNEAGNAAYSSVTCLVTVVDLDVTTNFWTGAGATKSWHDGANWIAGVPVTGQSVAITQAVDVVLGSSSASLASFTMTAGILTFSNWTTRLQAESINLRSGKLTLPPPFTDIQAPNRVWIVCSNLTVAASVTIDADARGYARGFGPGSANGASHGGRGSSGNWNQVAPAYGAEDEPTAPGSGGKGSNATTLSGDGGGAVRIDASGTVTLHGKVNANGGNRVTTHGGGGAGGSILINCRTFAGSATGSLSAIGGTGANFGGAGGGGRIAVIYDTAAQAATSPVNPGVNFNVSPGSAGYVQVFAEAGTLYFPDRALLSGTMGTQWGGGFLRIPNFTSWEIASLTVAGKFGLQGVTNLTVVNGLTLAASGALTLRSTPTNAVSPPDGILVNIGSDLCVTGTLALCSDELNGASPRVLCRNLIVAAGGKIDADTRGYTGLRTGGYSGPGNLVGFTRGAGHGGMGSSGWGRYNNAGPMYDDPLAPGQPGSGGGTYSGISGYGGGAIRVQATETATIHGTLTANGQSGIGTHGCGGSGGSIHIVCQTFRGSATGVLQAKGGNGDNYQAGAGAGGRIAVVYDPVQQAALPQPNPGVTFSVAPGTGGQFPHLAETGTLYLPDAETLFLSTNMTVQWQDVNFHIPGGMTHWSLPSLQVSGKFRIPGLETLTVSGDLALTSGGRLALYSHPTNTVSAEIGFRLDVGGALTVASGGEIVFASDLATGASPLITCHRFDLQTGALVQADYRGWDMDLGAGHGVFCAGGGYGGAGSRGSRSGGIAGPTNGVTWAPIWPGSGAGNFDTAGGRGGGLVRIGATGAMTIDGTVRANGMARKSETHAGGGSGGGILLTARKFSGKGILQANGGSSGNEGGAGGGGRIAVWTPYQTPEALRRMAEDSKPPASANVLNSAALYPDLTLSVAAGTGGTNPAEAKEGTIFFGHLVQGSLFILR